MRQLIINIIFGLLIIAIWVAQLSYENSNDKEVKRIEWLYSQIRDAYDYEINSIDWRITDENII